MTKRRRTQVLLALLSSIAGGAIGSYPFLTSKNLGKPLGRNVPVEPPNEANRVSHRLGFSLVYPPNWEILVTEDQPDPSINGPPSINGFPRTLIPSRISGIYVARLGKQRPDVSADRRTEFQGEPAYEHVSGRPGNWDDPPQFNYAIAFQRNGTWYRLLYGIGQERDTLPATVKPYFETFKAESRTAE